MTTRTGTLQILQIKLLLALLVFLAIGCSGDDDDTSPAATTPAASSTPQPSSSETPVATPSPEPTVQPTGTPEATTPTEAPTPWESTPIVSPTPSEGPTLTPEPASTPTPTSATLEPLPTATPGPPPTATPEAVPTPTATPMPVATATPGPPPTATPEPVPTPTLPPTATPSIDGDHDGYPLSVDCDDDNDTVYPGAPELCDGLDNNCNQEIDEGVQLVFYADTDGDGYGVESSTAVACVPPPGYAANAGDCDDTNPDVHPDAEETCNDQDDNCDGLVDEGVTQTFFLDADSDGHGANDTTVEACVTPDGYAETAGDCDDTNPSVHPGAEETCNHLDDDCDGDIDDGLETSRYYLDDDGDGYGAGDPEEDCMVPDGHSVETGDCNDADPEIHPGAKEFCDGVDSDCDGSTEHESGFFRDDFDQPAMDPCWEVISPNSDSSVYQDSDNGVLTLIASPADGGSDYFSTTNYNAPRVLHVPPADDWTVTIKLHFDPTQNYEGAGIMICFADGDDTDCWRAGERSFYPAAGGSSLLVVGNYVRYDEPDVFMKIEKQGDVYTGWYKATAEDEWVQNGTRTNTRPVGRVGVFAIRQPWDQDLAHYSEADFDWFDFSE